MKIQVTSDDIKKGEPGNACSCAISLALKRQFKTDDIQTKINHNKERVELRIDDKIYHTNNLSDEYLVSNFIDSFDNYIFCEDDEDYEIDNVVPEPFPIEFEIEEAR